MFNKKERKIVAALEDALIELLLVPNNQRDEKHWEAARIALTNSFNHTLGGKEFTVDEVRNIIHNIAAVREAAAKC